MKNMNKFSFKIKKTEYFFKFDNEIEMYHVTVYVNKKKSDGYYINKSGLDSHLTYIKHSREVENLEIIES
jgi:hypothetical protein